MFSKWIQIWLQCPRKQDGVLNNSRTWVHDSNTNLKQSAINPYINIGNLDKWFCKWNVARAIVTFWSWWMRMQKSHGVSVCSVLHWGEMERVEISYAWFYSWLKDLPSTWRLQQHRNYYYCQVCEALWILHSWALLKMRRLWLFIKYS